MKRQVLLSVLAAIAIFAVSTTAEAGMFGRLSLLRGGCSPCGEVACQPCEPACAPCEPACAPCEAACDPCGACDVGCDPCGRRPFRPFGGFFINLKNKVHAKFASCGTGCGPCDAACCAPCEPACAPCEPACAPCEAACDPCGACDVGCDAGCHGPFRPFGGFFVNLKNKVHAKFASCGTGCGPCEPACCAPCEPACDPCGACN